MSIEEGGRAPKLSSTAELAARVVPIRRGGSDLPVRGGARGRTSTSFALAHHLAQRADNRILITDIESLPSDGLLDDIRQAYTPIFIDGSGGSLCPVGGSVWEEVLRTLGLSKGEDCTC